MRWRDICSIREGVSDLHVNVEGYNLVFYERENWTYLFMLEKEECDKMLEEGGLPLLLNYIALQRCFGS